MDLHLTDEQTARLVAALDRLIENDRYPLSPRVQGVREDPGVAEAVTRNRDRLSGGSVFCRHVMVQ